MEKTINISEAVARLMQEHFIKKTATSREASELERYYYIMFTHPQDVKGRHEKEVMRLRMQEESLYLSVLSRCDPPIISEELMRKLKGKL